MPAGRTDSVDNVTDIIIETATEAADDLISQAFLRMNTALRGGVSFLTIGMLDQIILDLSAQLQGTLIDASLAGGISGAGEAIASVTKSADALFPVPDLPRLPPRGIESLTGERPGLRFPVIDDAVKTLTEAPVFGGEDFRDTADAVRRGAFAITTDAADETIRDVRTILADGIARGDDTAAFVDNIEAAFNEGVGLSKSRWRMIFRNNVGQAVSNSQDAALEAPAVEDAFPYRRYFATDDIRVRPEHLALEKLGLNGTAIYWKNDPVWEEFRPIWEWNCFLGDTVVQGEFNIATRIVYTGKVVEILTVGGNKLCVTVNHPILTDDGFVPAGTLAQGQNVFGYFAGTEDGLPAVGFPESPVGQPEPIKPIFTSPNVDKEYAPSRIDEIFRSLEEISGVRRVPMRTDDFYGDGKQGDGYVDIVAVNRQLLRSIDPPVPDSFKNISFPAMDSGESLEAGFGLLNQLGSGSNATTGSFPGSAALSSNSDGICLDSSPLEFLRFGPASRLDASRYKAVADDVPRDSEFLSDLLLRNAGSVQRDQIADIRISEFSGHVYDLQSKGGFIISENIVSSNCRCTWSPVTVLQAKEAGVREAIDWWERARKLSERFGGPVQSHLTETEPATHETVDHPPFSAPPEFQRETVA